MSYRPILCAVAAALGLSACTAGQTGPPPVTSVNPTSVGILQFAVGTANIGGIGVGLNLVATYRRANGGSAVLVGTPRLTGPFSLKGFTAAASSGQYAGSDGGLFLQGDPVTTADVGPGPDEIAGNFIGGTPQTSASNPNPGNPSTFGFSGDVFGNDIMPGNYTSTGNPYSYNPYYQPFYAGGGPPTPPTAANPTPAPATAFVPLGGPPVFDPNNDGGGVLDGKNAAGVNIRGISLGLAVFSGVTPVNGTYNLAVTLPVAGTPVVSAAPATLVNAAALLPIPDAPVLTQNNDGSASVSYTVPPGLKGAYVEVVDTSYCASGLPAAYTFWVTAPGPGSRAIPNTLGPKAGTGPAICTAAQNNAANGDPVETVLIGYNYDANALQYNGTTGQAYPQAPALPAGDADVTISPIKTYIMASNGTVTISSGGRHLQRRP